MPEEKISFIPKKTFVPRAAEPRRSFGLLLSLGIFLLVVSGLVFAGAFLYRDYLKKQSAELAVSLNRAKDAFDPNLISALIETSQKIGYAKTVVAGHQSLTGLFDTINRSTLKNVRFTSFDYSVSKDEGPVVILKGAAPSYADLAVQAEQFEKNNNIKSVNFSGLGLGANGDVQFTVRMPIDPAFLVYNPANGGSAGNAENQSADNSQNPSQSQPLSPQQ